MNDHVNGVDDQRSELIDLDDESLREPLRYDPTKNPDEYIPVPELDENLNRITYQLKLSVGENKFGDRAMYFKKDHSGKPMGVLRVDVEVVQPGGPFDRAKIASFYPTTQVSQKNSGTRITKLAMDLGEVMPTDYNSLQMKEHIERLLRAEPIVQGTLIWRAYCAHCDKDIRQFTGERNWPEKRDENGIPCGHHPVVVCRECKNDIRAKVEVAEINPNVA